MNMHAAKSPLPDAPKMLDILGVDTASMEWDEAIALLRRLVEEKRFTRVGFLNANNANIAYTNPPYRRALADYLVFPDGVGVDIAARMLYGSVFTANLNGTDFIPALLAAIPGRLTVGLLGARRQYVEAAAEVLKSGAPQHAYVVIRDGFFGPSDEPEVLAKIEAERPDILLVAMGVPRQELWIAENLTGNLCTMPIAVGALFDLISGAVPRAPGWVRRLRLEWLFRLMAEPRRLWRRYLVGNPLFLARVARQKFRGGRP